MSHMTVRMSDEQKHQIEQMAASEGMKPATWANRELRRALRRAQIRAYRGPDEDTRRWTASATLETERLWDATARADEEKDA